MIGGLAGVIIGLAGGAVGAYYSIKNTNDPKERKFMIKFTVLTAVLVALLLSVVFFIGYPGALWVMVPFFGFALPAMINLGNKKQREIRNKESLET